MRVCLLVAFLVGQSFIQDAAVHAAPAARVPAASGCFTVKDYSPFRTCKQEAEPQICKRGWGVFPTMEACCARGGAHAQGCSAPPAECWVVENQSLRTCVRDQRKCLQGHGVYASEALCCTPGVAFPEGCGRPPLAAKPCWVVDTYFPARTCKETRRLCTPAAGLTVFPSKAACCAPKGAFQEGCSTYVPSAPCYLVDTYDPVRKCRREDSLAACSRGWGVFPTNAVCCSPGAGFPEGCTQPASLPAAAAKPVTRVNGRRMT